MSMWCKYRIKKITSVAGSVLYYPQFSARLFFIYWGWDYYFDVRHPGFNGDLDMSQPALGFSTEAEARSFIEQQQHGDSAKEEILNT